MSSEQHSSKVFGLNEAQEDRILEALATFRQDIMEEMKSLRQMMKEAFDKSPLIPSQIGDYLHCDKKIFQSETGNIEYPQELVAEEADQEIMAAPIENNNSQSYVNYLLSAANKRTNLLLEEVDDLDRTADDVVSSFASTLMLGSQKGSGISTIAVDESGYDDSDDIVELRSNCLDGAVSLSHNFSQHDDKFSMNYSHSAAEKRKLSEKSSSTLGVYMESVNEFRKESGFQNNDAISCMAGPTIHRSRSTSESHNVPQMHSGLLNIKKKEFKCKFCSKCFSKSVNLNNHIMTHTGVKPFKCSVCNKGFIRHEQLKCHFRTHTGEKPYSCPECGRRFSYWSNYSVHKRTHTGEKPYKCDVCQKRFTQLNSLKRHKQCAHHKINLYQLK